MIAALIAVLAVAVAGDVAVVVDVDRTKQPAPAPETAWSAPAPVKLTVHGMDAYLVERHEIPIVDVAVMWNGGEVLDPPGKEGMTSLCTDLIGEGTKDLDKNALEDKKADIAASIDIGAGRESTRLGLRIAKDRLEPALDLVAQLLTAPGLRKSDFERLRAQRKASVLQAKGNADSVGARVVGPVVYGAQHAYGRIATEKSYDAISLDDCAKVASSLGPEGASVVVVGDVTKAELSSLFDARFAAWKGKAPARPRVGPPAPMKGTLFFVDVPGAAQSRITVAWPGPERKAADYWSTTIMAQVLGGGIPSRIVQNLREKNGYTYGARAAFSYARNGSMMMIASSVRTDATGKALREVESELVGIGARLPTHDEVERERLGGIRSLPSRFSTSASTLSTVWETLFFDLPLDTWQKMPAELNAVTADKVARAVKDHVKQKGIAVVVAGDRAKVFDELKDVAALFGTGGVVVLDGDALLVAQAAAAPVHATAP